MNNLHKIIQSVITKPREGIVMESLMNLFMIYINCRSKKNKLEKLFELWICCGQCYNSFFCQEKNLLS